MSIQLDDPHIVPSRAARKGSVLAKLGLPIAVALGCGIAGFVVCGILPKTYRVNTTVYFPVAGGGDSAAGLIGKVIGGGAGGAAADLAGGAASSDVGSISLLGGMFEEPQVASGSQTAIAVLDSVRCREAVADDLNLAQQWHMKKRSDVLATLQGMVTYGVDKNNLLDIEVDDTNPQQGVQIANSYLTNLQKIANDLSTSYSRRNRIFIEQETARVRAKLDQDQARLVAEQTSGGATMLGMDAPDKLAGEYLDLQDRETEAQITLDGADKQIDWMVHAANLTVKNSMELPRDMPVAQETRDQLRGLEAQFAYAKETLGPDNPDYNALKLRVETARSEMTQEVQREAAALKEGISPQVANLYANKVDLEAQRDGLVDADQKMQKVLLAMPAVEVRTARLQSEIKLSSTTLGMLDAEGEKARIAEQRDMASFLVVDAPELPEDPFKPRIGTTVLICLAAGFLIGCAWQIAGSMRRSIFDPEAVEEA